jgi:sugar phosphate isomerase/epimerase
MTSEPQLGVQLYSVREDIAPEQLDDTLARLAAMGFTHVEPYRILENTAALRSAMAASGLHAVTAHSNIIDLDREAVIAAAAELGIGTIIIPWVEPSSITDRVGVESLASRINEAARFARDVGIRIGYHNHDFEFIQQIDGVPAWELLVQLLDEEVILELDTYWASVGGADVFELIPRIGDRIRFLHVKDEPPDADGRPLLGVDITGRLAEVIALARDHLELAVVEVVVDDGDVFPVLERNAVFFLSQVTP